MDWGQSPWWPLSPFRQRRSSRNLRSATPQIGLDLPTLRSCSDPARFKLKPASRGDATNPVDRADKDTTWPQIEMHGGILPRVELSLAWDGLVSVAAPESTMSARQRSTGLADVRLGAKFGLVNRRRVNAALIVYGNLPIGSEAFSSHYADPRTRFAWATLHLGSLWIIRDRGSRIRA